MTFLEEEVEEEDSLLPKWQCSDCAVKQSLAKGVHRSRFFRTAVNYQIILKTGIKFLQVKIV